MSGVSEGVILKVYGAHKRCRVYRVQGSRTFGLRRANPEVFCRICKFIGYVGVMGLPGSCVRRI